MRFTAVAVLAALVSVVNSQATCTVCLSVSLLGGQILTTGNCIDGTSCISQVTLGIPDVADVVGGVNTFPSLPSESH